MCGRLTLAIEVSSTSMNVASVTVSATAHWLCFGRHSTVSPMFKCRTPAAGSSRPERLADEILRRRQCGAEQVARDGRGVPAAYALLQEHHKHDAWSDRGRVSDEPGVRLAG